MANCGWLIGGDPARPCVRAPGHPPKHRCKAYSKSHSDAAHAHALRRKYGLDPGEYLRIKAHQGGRCAICARATGRTKRLAVDHNHKTREVRGLLCSRCNGFLGAIRDSVEAAERTAEYLRNPPATQALGRVVLVPEDSPAQLSRKRRGKRCASRKTG